MILDRLIIASCSGFWGDRFSAAEEMVRGGPIDVLTGDYLAELTMAILHRSRLKNPRAGGYVPTFLAQLERVLGECLDRRIRVVTNAGGLDPRRLAEEIDALGRRLGVHPKVAWIDGDDLMPRLEELERAGEPLAHLDRGTPLAAVRAQVATANAYLGGWGIREALAAGADVVVCPRVTDAALVLGPAAWRFGWRQDDWDRLAGAVAAGHILECSGQATGGNYSFFFDEVASPTRSIGFPIAEMAADGSCVITKHPGTGGVVSVGTVTAQLLYEIQGPRYINPDVVARFDTLLVVEEAPDRVRVSGARGEPPPPTAKVCINHLAGFRNSMTVLLGGGDLLRKARLVEDQLFAALGGREQFARVDAQLDEVGGLAHLKLTVMSPDRERVGRRFANAVVELALSSVPGFSARTPPGDATPCIVYWPALIDRRHLMERVHLGDLPPIVVPPPPITAAVLPEILSPSPEPVAGTSPTVRAPLGRLFGARSGDKGGDASLGVWARTDEAWQFLRAFLTTARLRQLLPEIADLPVERAELANLRALHFVLRGLLGEGVSSSTRSDPQAKILGEQLRALEVDLPTKLVTDRKQ